MIQGIASKCHVGLRVARLDLCVSTESDGGFSPGYVLLSFQILTLYSVRCDYLELIQGHPTPDVQTGKNPPYKGGWLKIGPARSGGMNQYTPNPGWRSQVAPSFRPNPLNRVRLLPPNVNPLTTVELSTRSGCWQGVVMRRSCLLQTVLKLTSAGEHRTEMLRGIQTEQTSRTDLMRPEGTQPDTHFPPGDA